MALPRWHRAYWLFRVADGATAGIIPLLMVAHYGFPAYGVAAATATMNLAGVPATYLWGSIMENGRGRRRLATLGFGASAVGLGAMALLPHWSLYLAAAAVFTAFGVATAPAAGRLILEDHARGEWSMLTSRLNATLSWAYLVGMTTVIGVSLAGRLDLRWLFGATSALCAAAAISAWILIPKWRPLDVGDHAVEAVHTQRFERTVWFPSRLRSRLHWPRASFHQRLAIGVATMFFGTTMFMSTYTGVLADDLGLALGLVLLAQGPNHLTIPMTFNACSAVVARLGERVTARAGLLLRVLLIPGFALTVLMWQPRHFLVLYPVLLVLGALLGVGFAMMQSTLPVMAAASHPRTPGRGMGAYHAAVSMGVLVGSVSGFLGLLLIGLTASYVIASAAVAVGTWLTIRAMTRLEPPTTSAKNPVAA